MSDGSNYLGEITWYIVTDGEGVDIPDFVFHRDEAPYLIGQLHGGRIVVFNRNMMSSLFTQWQEAEEEMKTQP